MRGVDSPDLLRSKLSTFIQTLMSAEADALCGADYGPSARGHVVVQVAGLDHRLDPGRIGKAAMMTKAEHTLYIESARWKARAAQHLRRHPRCVCGRRDQLFNVIKGV